MKLPIIKISDEKLYDKLKMLAEKISKEENVKVFEIIKAPSDNIIFVANNGLAGIPNKNIADIIIENPAIYIVRGEIDIPDSINVEKEEDIEKIKTELLNRLKVLKVYSRLPRIDCKKCGRNTCYEMAIDIVKGSAKISDCAVLSSKKEIILKVKGQLIFLNPWVMDLFKKTILAMISTLKGVEINGDEKIRIEVE